MTISYINTGSAPNAGDGDTLRTAFNKINANFGLLYDGAINQLVQSDQPPVPASTTTLWYDTVSGRTYVYYDGTWIDASPSEQSQQSSFITTATIGQYAGYIQEVGLFNSITGTGSNTVTNVTHLNFDTESAFSVTDQGNGAVLIGMNSTFKYIEIANANTLTAVGLDTLTFVAGNGIELATNDTPGHQSITITSTIAPTTSTAGFLYDDGAGGYHWVEPTHSSLENGTSTFTLNANGSVTFNNGTVQDTAYTIPQEGNAYNTFLRILLADGIGNTATLYSTNNVSINPEMGEINLTYLRVGYNNVSGPPTSITLATSGTNYPSTGTNVQTTGGSGTGLTVDFHAPGGSINSLSINNRGGGYSIGDVVYINNSNSGTSATFVVSTVLNGGPHGNIEFADSTFQTTAYTGTVAWNNITGTANIVTTASLTTTNISTFINDKGYLTYANVYSLGYVTTSTINQYVSANSLTNNNHTATLTTAGNFILPGGLIIDYGSTPTITVTATSGGGLIASDVSAAPVKLSTFNGGTTYTWQFNPDGSITWPDGSVQASATTATIAAGTLTNHINYGTYTLAVLSTGSVQFPDGTVQTTAYTGTGITSAFASSSSYSVTASYAISATTAVSLLNNGVKLRPVSPPPSLVGNPGDTIGDFAYDGSDLYICYENYVQTNYNVTTVDTGTNVFYIDIIQGSYPQPQIGWEIHDPIGGPLMTITNVTSGLFGPYNTPYWRVGESTYLNNYIPGLTYTLVNPSGTTNVWGKVPFTTAANTSTAVTKLSSFVISGNPVTFDNVYAEWSGVGNNLKVGAVTGVFTATYNLSTFYAGSINVVNGNSVAFTTAGTVLGGTSLNPGDRAEMVLTIPNSQKAYRITAITGSSYNTNFISIEQLM